jgi:hypothetical protein
MVSGVTSRGRPFSTGHPTTLPAIINSETERVLLCSMMGSTSGSLERAPFTVTMTPSPAVSGAAGSKVSSVGESQWKRPLRRGLKVTFSLPSTTGWLKESVSAQSGRSQLGTVKVRCCGSGGAVGTCGVEASGAGGGRGASTRVAAPASGATVEVVQAIETTVASKTMPTGRG